MADPISTSSSPMKGPQGAPQSPAKSTRSTSSASPASPTQGAATQAMAFRALLDKLAGRAQELESTSSKPMNADELAGAVDRAHESLQDALTLSEQLIESFRAAQQRAVAPQEPPKS
jgi:hypothetical protein